MTVQCLLIFLAMLFCDGFSKPDILIGNRITVAVPVVYNAGFIGRAFLMETDQKEPNFRTALTVSPVNGSYSCSLEVYLGDVRVWNSGHYSQFLTIDKCILHLTEDGDLQLKGPKERVGWRTGTSGQGVERLVILNTGNLVLVDALDHIKWQSFNFPTDVMLWGQRLNVATRLTSFQVNPSMFYTFEIQHNRIALNLTSGKSNYTYWEFKPSNNRNITFIQLGARGLMFFDDKNLKIAQISSRMNQFQPLRFLALGNKTGNLGLYFYSPEKNSFEAAFQALNTTCDLPLSCAPYGICTFSNTCSCIRVVMNQERTGSGCAEGFDGEFCDKTQAEMLELNGVTSVLKGATKRVNVSKETCTKVCLDDCKCAAALYSSGEKENSSGECSLYRLVVGVKQVEPHSGLTYMVKVSKGSHVNHRKGGVKKWVVILVGVVDGLIILVVVGGLAYYFIWRKNEERTSH